MSNIFDALQKSEEESSGRDALHDAEVIEVLRRAERRVAARWQSSAGEAPQTVTSQRLAVSSTTLTASDGTSIFDRVCSLKASPTAESRLISITQADSPAAEAFRLLSVRLRHLQRDRAIKRLLITSTVPQEGKSVVSSNLACTLASKGKKKVLLLEGDLRRPSLMTIFGLEGNPGLCECFEDGRQLEACIYHLEDPGMWILPAGRSSSNPLHLLQSERLPRLMDQLNDWFDWLIIDSPPVLPLADTSVWARLTDGIILVTRQGITEKRELKNSLEALDPQKLFGALINCSTTPVHCDYYYGSPARHSRTRLERERSVPIR